MTADLVSRPSVDSLDVPRLLDWLATSPPPDEVTATREEALRRADYLRGRDTGQVVALRKAARIVEWEMAHRWPANGRGRGRTDDRPNIDASTFGNQEAWSRVYAVGAQPREWILSRTEPEELTQAAIIRGPQAGPPPISTGGAVDWYTPAEYVEAARRVLGGIDCDPASSPVAQVTVRAAVYFTEQDNGLAQPWLGNVWLNPPYKTALIVPFIERVTTHPGQWITLTNNGTDTSWGQSLLRAADVVCFTNHRIRFLNQDAEQQGPAMQGQMFAYRGDNPRRFADEFAAFGQIMTADPC